MTSAAGESSNKVKPELADFAGKWRLMRKIVQHNGDVFEFAGDAAFCWREGLLIYKETGLVTAPNGTKMDAERSYLWRRGADSKIDVFFDDNRFFHSFSRHQPVAHHHCGDDHYRVNYTFDTWPVWQSIWKVDGPRKDYKMTSHYYPV
ncbi:hypothetical protein GCM10007391_29560 [Alteromonas halophila]|uniref:DUF6314 domain-containing protein n=2 Tax=Alteromonas halophila TaxID=516698 RepID=A0A918JQF2_9ALTE|nr:hypothetical protein GCM10007391_29560 [Alteromonas halophila]